MIRLNYATLSHGISIDSATGGVTLFHLVEEIRIPKERLPLAIPEVVFCGALTRLDSRIQKTKLKLEYLSPKGAPVLLQEGEAPFQGDKLRVVVRLNGMPLEQLGRYKMRLNWSWNNPETGAPDDDCEGAMDVVFDVIHAPLPEGPVPGQPTLQ